MTRRRSGATRPAAGAKSQYSSRSYYYQRPYPYPYYERRYYNGRGLFASGW